MAKFDKQKILEQLNSLKNLPQVKEVKALKHRLERELASLTTVKPVIVQVSTYEKKIQLKSTLSSRAKKYWRFIKLAHDRVPNVSVSEIRRQFKKRRAQGQSDIPDAIWQNVSG
jgi:hypothetical protein